VAPLFAWSTPEKSIYQSDGCERSQADEELALFHLPAFFRGKSSASDTS